MPIPQPRSDERDQQAFISRCMGDDAMQEYDQKQRAAICYSQWRDHEKKSIDTGTGLVAYDLQGQRKEASMNGGPWRLYGRIEKVEEVGDGTIKVHGVASTPAEDDQGEIVDAAAMREAIPDYMRFGAVREMHGLTAAGRALECNCGNDDITRIVAHIVDPIAVKKVQHQVYNGFSIGGRVLDRAPGEYKKITRLALHEISLVDRPANPQARIDLWKSTTSVLGGNSMPDGNGLGTMEAAWADALAKVGAQIWPCSDSSHKHSKKDEAAKCILEKAGRPQVGDPQRAAEDAMKARKPFPNASPPFGSVDDEAEKHGFPGQEIATPSGHTAKYGEPGQGITRPAGRAPGAPDAEENFDGDHDSDDDETSAESAGGGYQPESDAERHEDFGKKKNGNGSKPYGNVAYADPGYQSDGKKRYPIDTEAHVRAAWSYINQADNARAYSSEQLGRVKAKIRAAAKRHGIEISEKAAFDLGDQDALLKALSITCIDTLLPELPYDLDLIIEKAGRRQSAADTFVKQIAHDAINKLSDGQFCQKAENATQDTARNAEHEAPNQGTDSGTEHYRLGENSTQDTAKRGARHSTMTMKYLKKAHDNICAAGAACPAHGDNGMSKASTTEDGAMGALNTDDETEALKMALKKKFDKKLRKATEAMTLQMENRWQQWKLEQIAKGSDASNPPSPPIAAPEKGGKLKKELGVLAQGLADTKELLQQIAKQPVPGSAAHLPAGIIGITKGEDGAQGGGPNLDALKSLSAEQLQALEVAKSKMTPEERFKWDWNVFSRSTPYVQQR